MEFPHSNIQYVIDTINMGTKHVWTIVTRFVLLPWNRVLDLASQFAARLRTKTLRYASQFAEIGDPNTIQTFTRKITIERREPEFEINRKFRIKLICTERFGLQEMKASPSVD